MIRITSKQSGFRRCGVAHPAQPTDHPTDHFSKKEIEILKAEPMLMVTEVEDKTSAQTQTGTKSGSSGNEKTPAELAAIGEAIGKVAKDDLSKWTKKGKGRPTTEAIEDKMEGEVQVKPAEADAAWKLINKGDD